MLGFGGIFGRKPHQFNYRPRYYDPDKEARDKRRIELGLGPEDKHERKPGDMLRRKRSLTLERIDATRRSGKSRYSVRLIIVVLVLLVMLAWILVRR